MHNSTQTTKTRLKQILRFLRASQEPEMFERLSHFGFCAQDLANGWQLLHTAIVASDACQGCDTVDSICLWGNYWIPCARDALATRYPRAFDHLCRGLPTQRSAGIEAVALFIRRLETLRTKAKTCLQSRAACALLESRGLSQPVVKSAAILIAQAPPHDVVRDAIQARDQALGRAWAFYQRWLHLILPRTMEGEFLRHLGLDAAQHESDVYETRPRRYDLESESSEALRALARNGPGEFAKMETRKLSRADILAHAASDDEATGVKSQKRKPYLPIAATQKMPRKWFDEMRRIESHQKAWQDEKSRTRQLPVVTVPVLGDEER